MFTLDHNKTPLVDGLKAYQKRRVVSLDVPGHKQGKSNVELIDIFGQMHPKLLIILRIQHQSLKKHNS